jgi:hypothetical protein
MRKVRNYRITATAKEVKGLCLSGLRSGDRVSMILPQVDMRNTDKICVNTISALMPFVRQFSSEQLPYNTRAVVSSPDPGPTQ